MIQKDASVIYEEINEETLKQTLKNIVSFHRIQASPGYHDAAVFCANRLSQNGIHAEIFQRDAREGVFFQTAPDFESWHCRNAWCRLDETEEILCDYQQNPVSIIQKSGPWNNPEIPLEVIDLDRGPSEDSYKDIDFQGKIVLVHQHFSAVRDWAVEKRGAIGYITDYTEPEPEFHGTPDLDHARKYTSFWWRPGQKRVFGFVVTPAQGKKLSLLAQKRKRQNVPLTVHCLMDTELYPGKLEMVVASIPGKTAESILLIAHLCHPKPSANDNASGAAAALEALCALNHLIQRGTLKRPLRTIRLLLTPEILGTYAWLDSLDTCERKQIFMAMTLDMVGGRQSGDRGPLTLYETPHCMPSCANMTAGYLFRLLSHNIHALNAVNMHSMYNTCISEFIDGSDHGVCNDSLCGIPSPLLCQWPDKYYHTDQDTFDQIDFGMLHLSCALAASWAYQNAAPCLDDLPFLLNHHRMRLTEDLANLMNTYYQEGIQDKHRLSALVSHYLHYYQTSCENLARLFSHSILGKSSSVFSLPAVLSREKERLRRIACCITGLESRETVFSSFADAIFPHSARYSYVPKRCFWGRLDYGLGWYEQKPEFQSAISDYHRRMAGIQTDFETLTLMYMDNRRSLAEIAACVAMDLRRDEIAYIDAYVHLLKKIGLVTFEEVSK